MSNFTKSLLLKCAKLRAGTFFLLYALALGLCTFGVILTTNAFLSALLVFLMVLMFVMMMTYGKLIHKKQLYDKQVNQSGVSFADEVYERLNWDKWWE